jgi:hypothetical protein
LRRVTSNVSVLENFGERFREKHSCFAGASRALRGGGPDVCI